METNRARHIAHSLGERPLFRPGDAIQTLTLTPVGHYRVPLYVRGKRGTIEAVIEPRALDNGEEGFGRNAGSKRHYYRVAFPMTEIWPNYAGSSKDELRIEVYETWLKGI